MSPTDNDQEAQVTASAGDGASVVWDGRRHSYRPRGDWLSRVSPRLRLNRAVDSELDPTTFEVMRNRLWSINLAHGETLARISGSPVFQALDFNMCMLTEDAELVVNAPFITYLSVPAPLSVPYIMEHFAEAPGIEDGDMYLSSDPWIGAVHQMDVLIACPVFVDDGLFAWVCNAGHQYDMGGIVPGGWPQNALDIYYDPVLFSPFKIVEKDVLRSDLELMYRRQSRMPELVALDLRSQIAGCRYARRELLEMCREFGAATVKAGMRRILDNAQRSFRDRLARVPDGDFSEIRYLAERMPGDRGTYRTQLNVAKRGDRLRIDNEGTDAEMEGPLGFVFAVFAGWVQGMLAVTMLWEHTFSVGGASRQLDLDPTPGLLTCIDYPRAAAGGVISSGAVAGAMLGVISRMLACDPEHKRDMLGAGIGGGALTVLSGRTDRGDYVGQAVFESNAAGTSGRPGSDGVDMAGLGAASPLMKLLNVEEYEVFFPVVYLYRRERQDVAVRAAGAAA